MERSLKRLNILKGHLVANTSEEHPDGVMHVKIKEEQRIAILTWDFPKVLNALGPELIDPFIQKLNEFEQDDRIGAVILTGIKNTFWSGYNIANFHKDFDYTGGVKFKDLYEISWTKHISDFSKPLIAAVNGYWLGGGLEVALMCDMIIASDQASFGLPEIKLGLIPGAGGTQSLIRSVGKSKAMEMILSGVPIKADEALKYSLVSKVVPHEKLLEESVKVAKKCAKMSLPSLCSAKKSVKYAYESTLSQGVDYERAMFNSLTGTQDVIEGVSAFLSKRKPTWTHR